MSRRRRLALRQVAEPELTAALSDVEDAREQEETLVAEPNFNLLGMMHGGDGAMAEVPRTTSLPTGLPPTAIYEAADGDELMDQAPTQVVPSVSENGSVAVPPAKKPRVEESHPVSKNGARGVFQLYQTGLCDDHTLRLHFIRRKPPPPPETRIENEFVLPRPRLSLLDLLPPQTSSVHEILSADKEDTTSSEPISASLRAIDEVLQTATAHWKNLEAAPADAVESWRELQEGDWMEMYEITASYVPPPDNLIYLLETVRSDAFAAFVWKEVLVPTIQTLQRDQAPSSTFTRLSTALLSHEYFRRLPAKDFRAQLRAKDLRVCVGASFGAAAELELITHFHKYRNLYG